VSSAPGFNAWLGKRAAPLAPGSRGELEVQVWPGGRPWRTGDAGAIENEGIREKKEMEKIKK
jgi:hypothetical protein